MSTLGRTYIFQVTKQCVPKSWLGIRYTQSSRPLDFNISENGMVLDRVLGSTLQLTFNKLLIVNFWCSFKVYSKLSGNVIKIILPFLTT